MNWEVWTMKSRISCCNAGLLRRSILRGAPLWGLWTLGGLLLLPLHLLSLFRVDSRETTEYLLGITQVGTVLVFGYGLLVAWFLFAYLYNTRTAYHYGSLPLRRETQFLTRYLAGLLFHLVPAAVIALLTILVTALQGANCLAASGTFFAATSLVYLFYYSLAVLIAQLVGHIAALPVLYVVLNFTSVVVETILAGVIRTFTFGMASGQNLWPDWLSPLFYSLQKNLFGYETIWDEVTGEFQSVQFNGWVPALVFGAVGLGFALLAFLLCRKRHLETAGDVIAVSFLKPVFLYALSLGCGIVLGWVFSEYLFYNGRNRFLTMLICMLLGTALGYWAGQMLLQKSLRVLSKGNWIRCGAALLVVAAGMLCCRYDITGFSRYVPDAEDVESISLDYDGGIVTDRGIIEKTVALHQEIVDQRYAIEAEAAQAPWSPSFRITYRLQDGSYVLRSFPLPVYGFDYETADRSSLAWAASELQNDPKVLEAKYFPANGVPAYDRWRVEYYTEDGSYMEPLNLTYDQGKQLAEAIRADIEAGALGGDGISWPHENLPVDLILRYYYGDAVSECGLSLTKEAEATCAVLREIGIPETVFEP